MTNNNNNAAASSLKATVKDQSGHSKFRIGEALKKQGHLTLKQLENAKEQQKKQGGRLSSILVKLGYIEPQTIFTFLTRQFGFQPAYLDKESPSEEALAAMAYATAKKYLAFPLRLTKKNLQVAMSEPTDTSLVEALQQEVKYNLSIVVASEPDIIDAFRRHYRISEEEYRSLKGINDQEANADESIANIEDFGELASAAAEGLELESLGDQQDSSSQYTYADAPIIKLVNGILLKAVNDGVSDIHIEPYETSVQIRYRLDGALFRSMNLPVEIKNALVSRIKILASLDITERRRPQDGRIRIRIDRNRSVDFRISTLPTLFGERIVIRILDKKSVNVDLTKLGFEEETFQTLLHAIKRPQGLILVTGPTGSGKTVTLYSILNSLLSEDTNIMTAEDPVEFEFKGISQVNVNNEVGMTFAAALKAFLRQDPDVIMVGEIRDMETAEIAIKAAMTGHLVFSTIHTNDCVSTVNRLIDIGIPPYMVSSALTMVLSQRLGRRLCPHCKAKQGQLPQNEMAAMGFHHDEIPQLELYEPTGCDECNGLGYKGRVGFFELMENTENIAKAISANVGEDELRQIAIAEGMKTLRMAALQKAREGTTSVHEVKKRTVLTEGFLPKSTVIHAVEEYQDGEFIIREGETDSDFFKLIKGGVSVIKNGKKIYEINEAGEIFGEMAAICNMARTASVVANGHAVVNRFPGKDFYAVLGAKPDLGRQVMTTMARRLTQANRLIIELASQNKKSTTKDPYIFQAWAQSLPVERNEPLDESAESVTH